MLRQYVELPRAVHLLCAGTLINRVGSFIVLFLTIYVDDELDFGIAYATRCMGAFGLGSVCASIVGGQLADRIGRRPVLLISLFGGALMLAVLSQITSRALFLPAIFVFALLVEMYRPAASALIGDLVEPSARPYAFSLMYLSVNLGFTFGALLGGWLVSFGFQILFWGDAATTAAYGLIVLFFIRETAPSRVFSKPGSEGTGDWTIGRAARSILADGVFLIVCLSVLLNTMVFQQGFSTLPLYLQSVGYDPGDYARMISLNGILIVTLQLPATALLGRFDRRNVLALGFLTIGVGFGMTGLGSASWIIAGSITTWTLGEIAIAPAIPALVTDLAPVPLRARYHAVLSTCFASSVAVGAPLGGQVLARLGSGWLWGGSFGLAALSALVFASIRGRLREREG